MQIFGKLYQGISPQVFVCDPELLRSILVKNFDHFYNRREVDTGKGLLEEMLDFIPGKQLLRYNIYGIITNPLL